MDGYAKEGLRTLLLAHKKLPKDVYEEWNKKHRAASMSVTSRDEELEAVAKILEKDFNISGSTAIEDRL